MTRTSWRWRLGTGGGLSRRWQPGVRRERGHYRKNDCWRATERRRASRTPCEWGLAHFMVVLPGKVVSNPRFLSSAAHVWPSVCVLVLLCVCTEPPIFSSSFNRPHILLFLWCGQFAISQRQSDPPVRSIKVNILRNCKKKQEEY